MQRQVIYFCFQDPEKNPPCLTEMYQLVDRGYRVILVSAFCSDTFAKQLRKRNIHCARFKLSQSKNVLARKGRNLLLFIRGWNLILRKYLTDDTVLWIGNEKSAFKHWFLLRGKHPVILNSLEFYEDPVWQKKMRKIVPDVDVLTACEPHRAQYMKDWWNLKELPFILRNKPYAHPGKRNMRGSTQQTCEAIARMQGKKILMYQGAIEKDRDLSLLAEALSHSDSGYWLTLSGPVKDDTLQKVQKLYDRVLYLGNISPEYFLEVTSWAHICVAYYRDNCINNRCCAPNKIYEYTGFGIPVLCNNITGLQTTIGDAGAGVCVDFSDERALMNAISEINEHYEKYSANALRFYQETDNTPVMDEILEKAFSLTKAEKGHLA